VTVNWTSGQGSHISSELTDEIVVEGSHRGIAPETNSGSVGHFDLNIQRPLRTFKTGTGHKRLIGHLGPLPVWYMSTVERYAWSPSHDQRGMLRPLGTS
jgi:hypothetical protein